MTSWALIQNSLALCRAGSDSDTNSPDSDRLQIQNVMVLSTTMVNAVALQREGPGYQSRAGPGPFFVWRLHLLPRACVGFIRVLPFPPPSKRVGLVSSIQCESKEHATHTEAGVVSNSRHSSQVAAAEEPVGSFLLDGALGGRLVRLASAPEEGALHPAG